MVESNGEEGLEAGQIIVGHDAGALLTGDIDPEAGDIISAGGVEAYICTDGTVMSAIERFLTGDLEIRPGPSRGFYPGPGSAETPHSRDASPGSDPGREEAEEEVVGVEVQCICPLCGTVVPLGASSGTCELMECPHCGSNMDRHETIE
jgi:predicted Fe-Mo cluster-binding NifX family protein